MERGALHKHNKRPESQSPVLAEAVEKYLRHWLPDWAAQQGIHIGPHAESKGHVNS